MSTATQDTKLLLRRVPILTLDGERYGYRCEWMKGLGVAARDGRAMGVALASHAGRGAARGDRIVVSTTDTDLSDLPGGSDASAPVAIELDLPDARPAQIERAMAAADHAEQLGATMATAALIPEALRGRIGFISFRAADPGAVSESAAARRAYPHAMLMARDVDSFHAVEDARHAGARLLEGYYFCEPIRLDTDRLPVLRASHLQLMKLLGDPDVDINAVAAVIRSDPAMSLALLRLVNSAAVAVSHEVTSLEQAVALLGLRPLKRWACQEVLAKAAANRPTELITTCLMRGAFCESVGEGVDAIEHAFDCFLAGLLSAIDAVTGQHTQTMLSQLGVNETVTRAVLDHDGVVGSILQLVRACELGEWTEISRLTGELGIDSSLIAKAQSTAIQEVKRMGR